MPPEHNANSQGAEDPSSSFQWYIQNTILKHRDARAEGQTSKAWSYFEDALQALLAYMDLDVRRLIEQDKALFDQLEDQILTSSANPETKKVQLTNIKESFMRTHRAYIFLTLPRAKVITIIDEGEIKFDKTDFDTTIAIVRSSSLIKGAKDKEQDPDVATPS